MPIPLSMDASLQVSGGKALADTSFEVDRRCETGWRICIDKYH
jgi:hypothetical protein